MFHKHSLIFLILQLHDDLLDFTSCDSVMGKPTAADLKLGLATAPVLFAAEVSSPFVVDFTTQGSFSGKILQNSLDSKQ